MHLKDTTRWRCCQSFIQFPIMHNNPSNILQQPVVLFIYFLFVVPTFLYYHNSVRVTFMLTHGLEGSCCIYKGVEIQAFSTTLLNNGHQCFRDTAVHCTYAGSKGICLPFVAGSVFSTKQNKSICVLVLNLSHWHFIHHCCLRTL